MQVVGLFAGIGGLERGLAVADHHAALLCEIDPGARAILAAAFPNTPIAPDVADLEPLPAGTELLAAGFPCQDLSQAGLTHGIKGARSGLVQHVFRLLESRDVPWVLLENVPFMLELAGGGAMNAIVVELQRLGYRWCYRVVNAASFGLPQRRLRVYLLACRVADPATVLFADEAEHTLPATRIGSLAHGFYWTEGIRGLGWAPDAVPTLKNGSTIGIPSPPAILMPDLSIVMPDIRDAERLQGFPVDWTKPAETVVRVSRRWSLVGNAVSVPVAAWLGRRLAEPGVYDTGRDRGPIGARWPKAARWDGRRQHAVDIGPYPVAEPGQHLHEFLGHPGKLLSERAVSGFYARTQRSSLRFEPGFLAAVAAHLDRMRLGHLRVAAE
jgi:DNA (cytosine-5)-methyltransferase 1